MSSELYFATVGKVYADGVSLIFDGTDTESKKHYKVNTSVSFKAGDRVKILPYNGTYVVEYVVGVPSNSNAGGSSLPSGGIDGYVLAKNSDKDGDVTWKAMAPAVANYADSTKAIWIRYVSGTGYQMAASIFAVGTFVLPLFALPITEICK